MVTDVYSLVDGNADLTGLRGGDGATLTDLHSLAEEYKEIFHGHTGRPFRQAPHAAPGGWGFAGDDIEGAFW